MQGREERQRQRRSSQEKNRAAFRQHPGSASKETQDSIFELFYRTKPQPKEDVLGFPGSACCCAVTQLCPPLWDPVDCSTPGLPVLHCHLEFAQTHVHWVSNAIQPSHTSGNESTCQCRRHKRHGSIPGSRRSPGGGNGNPLKYSFLENSMNRGAWWSTIYRVAKSQTWLSDWAQTQRKMFSSVQSLFATPWTASP